MKKFRIAPCLTKDGIKDFAIFEDGSRRKIIKSSNKYGKYFEVDNDLNPNANILQKYSFTGRIEDAVKTIMNGNGDVISTYKLLGEHITVQYFIDRTIGDEKRSKSIDGWKDAKFGWVVKCGNKNSFSGYAPINDKGERISAMDENRKPKIFTTEKEAKKFIDDLISKASEFARAISDTVKSANSKFESSDAIRKGLDDIKESTGTEFSVIQDIVYDMLTGDGKLKSDKYTFDWGYNIEQWVIQD